MIGRTISHYKITEKLGGGAMGVVYGAVDLRLDRVVALKFLPASLEADEERKRRFLQEAKAASALDHPNICTIHHIDETDDGQMFIVMSCYRGETLKSKIDRGRLPLQEALQYAMQAAQGLAKARHEGIVHRDIKPANIIVTTDGVVKLLDFGLARLIEETKITVPGSLLGTPAYMSPEQAQGGEIRHRTDIWSLGVVLYEMVTGQRPFRGVHQSAVIYSLLHEDPAPLTDLPMEVSDGLNRVISKALTKAPDERYQEVEGMLADLQAVSKLLETGAPTLLSKAEEPRQKRNISAYVTASALAAVVLAVVFYLNWGRQSGPGAEPGTAPSSAANVTQLEPSNESREAPPEVQSETPTQESRESPADVRSQPPSRENRAVRPNVASTGGGTAVPAPPERTSPARSQPPAARAEAPPKTANVSQPVAPPDQSGESEKATQPPSQQDQAPPAVAEQPQTVAVRREPSGSSATPPPPAPQTADARQSNELADWARIRNSTDIGALEEFLRKYPDGVFRGEATNRIENLKWEAARASDNPAAVRTYLQEFPSGPHAEQARALIAKLGSRPSEGDLIRRVIREFAAAYERRDAEAIAALWPSLKSDQLTSISNSFRAARSVRYELQPVSDPVIANGKATIRYRRSVQFEFAASPPKPVQDDVSFSLSKRGTTWVIDQVESR